MAHITFSRDGPADGQPALRADFAPVLRQGRRRQSEDGLVRPLGPVEGAHLCDETAVTGVVKPDPRALPQNRAGS